MDIDTFRHICLGLPGVTEGIKWGDDLCFMVGEKMFFVIVLHTPLKVSFKVLDDEFDEMIHIQGILPAPYASRYKWILVEDVYIFNKVEWEHFITQSYNLVRAKLSKSKIAALKS